MENSDEKPTTTVQSNDKVDGNSLFSDLSIKSPSKQDSRIQSRNPTESSGIQFNPNSNSSTVESTGKSLMLVEEQSKPGTKKSDEFQRTAPSSKSLLQGAGPSYMHLNEVEELDVEKFTDILVQLSKTKEEKDSSSSENPTDEPGVPSIEEILAIHSPLENACAVFPYFLSSKREELKLKENEMDIASVDLQKAMTDARNMCNMLQKVESSEIPEELSAAIVQAERFMYLLSRSYDIFQKLYNLGTSLNDNFQMYSADAEYGHTTIDKLLSYIIKSIL